jgi:hypothetical protein
MLSSTCLYVEYDSDDEMMIHMLMEKEATVAAGERGHFMILAGLLKLEEKEEKAFPSMEVQSVGRKKLKPRQRMEGHVMLYTVHISQRIFAGDSG